MDVQIPVSTAAEQFSEIPLIKNIRPDRFLLIAGPCVVENSNMPLEIASTIQSICNDLQIPFIFKASYKKANRSRIDSFSGIGDDRALNALAEVGSQLNLPVLTDVHTEEEAKKATPYVDIIQIPAFLCRQTSLLIAAGETGKWVNIKKGQFLSPEAMRFAVDKVISTGNNKIMVTERGTTFGYQDIIVDFRGIPTMQAYAPVILDCTHALQRPNQASGVTGGDPSMISTLARAGIAVGADGLFIETHPDPGKARSDGANMLPLSNLKSLLKSVIAIKEVLV